MNQEPPTFPKPFPDVLSSGLMTEWIVVFTRFWGETDTTRQTSLSEMKP
jgi:hypothetical protein